MKASFISCCFIILLTSCEIDQGGMDQISSKTYSGQADTFSIDLLVFKSEDIIEIWQKPQKGSAKYVKKLLLAHRLNWPIGVFEWNIEDETALSFKFPSPFYQQKFAMGAVPHREVFYYSDFRNALSEKDFHYLQSLAKDASSGRLLICPNKPAKNKHFKATINAPHWTAELYAILELELKNYPLKYGN